MLFTIDLDYMQKLKLLADNSQFVGCMICLYTCLYGRFEALKDRTPSVGYACPKQQLINGNAHLFTIILSPFNRPNQNLA